METPNKLVVLHNIQVLVKDTSVSVTAHGAFVTIIVQFAPYTNALSSLSSTRSSTSSAYKNTLKFTYELCSAQKKFGSFALVMKGGKGNGREKEEVGRRGVRKEGGKSGTT